MLLVAAYQDLKTRRIPNPLLLLGFFAALLFSLLARSLPLPQLVAGGALGLFLLLPFYAKGMIGAGDVKLMGVIGTFLGMKGVMVSALITLLAGGLLALWFIFFRLGRHIPYAVAILAGTGGYAILSRISPALMTFPILGAR